MLNLDADCAIRGIPINPRFTKGINRLYNELHVIPVSLQVCVQLFNITLYV